MALLDGLSILYVEDEPDTREVIALGLERHGARVYATDSASAALLMFETQRSATSGHLDADPCDNPTLLRCGRPGGFRTSARPPARTASHS